MNENVQSLTLIIETMRDVDLHCVVSIERECDLSSRGVERYRQLLSDQKSVLLVAVAINTEAHIRDVIGLFSASIVVDEAQLDNVAVVERWRRKGVASFLLLEGLHAASQKGAKTAVLEVRSANLPARSLYNHHGFVIAGLRPAYYHDPPDDALMMTCDIDETLAKRPIKKLMMTRNLTLAR
ncbi:MAG: GNAT family N-acetyltransferase [Acidobacteria bacterium]|nr:GNAT family N-acetyltransferase [Acidobacteriota bacterium]